MSLRDSATTAWETVTSDNTELVVQDDAEIAAYPSQLRRVFENLVLIALDHLDATKIRAGTLDCDGDRFYFQDDGSGISAADRGTIFGAGYSTNKNSTGYGLHIVESLAEMHDWAISVTESRNGCTRFDIRDITAIERDA